MGYGMAAAGVLAADQLSKVVALGTLGLNGRELTIIPGLLSFQVIRNTGAAFGLFQSMGPLLAVTTMVVLYAMYKFARHEEDPLLLGSLTLILGGAAGNLVDRLVRGGVIDFISLPNWPVFNLADCAITVGAAGILFFGFIVQRSRVVEADAPDPT